MESTTPAIDTDLADAWPRIQRELQLAVGTHTFDVWLAPLSPVGLEGDTLLLRTPEAIRAWVTDRLLPSLESCTAAVLGPQAAVELISDTPARSRPRAPRSTAAQSRSRPSVDDHAASDPGHDRFNPKLNFDQFVIGHSNQLAHAASLAVAELPGQTYNPLFLCGPPGVGKTHLLHAIGNYVRANGDGLTVRYTTTERFTADFVAAIRHGRVDVFKGRFRRADVLLVDDVQFLAAKARTEEEFFHTFNALHDAGAQLVLTSDRPPRDLDGLEDRLRERFEAGLVCEIGRPDPGIRLAVLRKRIQLDGISLADPGALTVIADRISDNVRALEGALIRIVAHHSLTGRPIDAELAHEVLDGLSPGSRRPTFTTADASSAPTATPTIDDILRLTGEAFGLTREDLLSASRATVVAWPRQVAMYLAREHTAESLPSIGRAFAGRNHTTVMHACRRTAQRMAADPEAFEQVCTLAARLSASPS